MCSYISSTKFCDHAHAGVPLNVTSPTEALQLRSSWQDIVKDDSPGGWSYDKEQHVLWIRLNKSRLANISLKM